MTACSTTSSSVTASTPVSGTDSSGKETAGVIINDTVDASDVSKGEVDASQFIVKYTPGSSKSTSKLTVSGSDRHIITDEERKLFGIDDSKKLREAVRAYIDKKLKDDSDSNNDKTGKTPNDAWVKSKAKVNDTNKDLYNDYGWSQIYATVTAKSATLDTWSFTNKLEPTSTLCTNKSSVPLSCEVKKSTSITQSYSDEWSTETEIGITATVDMEVVEAETSVKETFGKKTTKSYSSTVGDEVTTSVTVQPGESVQGFINAQEGKLTGTITYEISLDGIVAMNYDDKYKIPGESDSHHFYGISIKSILPTYKKDITQKMNIDGVGNYDFEAVNAPSITSIDTPTSTSTQTTFLVRGANLLQGLDTMVASIGGTKAVSCNATTSSLATVVFDRPSKDLTGKLNLYITDSLTADSPSSVTVPKK
jgi:hypothetical protein